MRLIDSGEAVDEARTHKPRRNSCVVLFFANMVGFFSTLWDMHAVAITNENNT